MRNFVFVDYLLHSFNDVNDHFYTAAYDKAYSATAQD